jgi:hypothetical protein
MFSDLLTFQTPKLAKANMVVAHLQLVLKICGRTEDAMRLEGLDITNPEMAQVALSILSAMRLDGDEPMATRTFALRAVQEALNDYPQYAHAN